MIALANKDYKKAIHENKKVSYYIKDKSLNLLLKSGLRLEIFPLGKFFNILGA